MGDPYTVLVVDDEPMVLEVLASILAEPGYSVLTARGGYEAIRILADRHIDLMLADIRMPGFDGEQLAVQAKLMRPGLRVIYITGFSDADEKARYEKVLHKPVRAVDLVETVEKALAAA